MRERESWPEEMSERRRSDDARDLYLLAVVSFLRSPELPGGPKADEPTWQDHYRRAEELFRQTFSPSMDHADIHAGVREKALEVLPRSGLDG